MNSIFSEISKLRKGAAFVIDSKNSNRYRVVAMEPDGSKTAYYFTSPIYNNRTRKAIDMKFYSNGATVYSTGSNANITVTGNVRMENAEGSCIISLANRANLISDKEILCSNERLYPTTNGIAIRSACERGKPYTFSVDVSKPFSEIRANDKYFALMSGRFRPFLTISCIGTSDEKGNIISPAKLTFQKNTNRKYIITITPYSALGKAILAEANLYEPKLFQDTTVESKNPKGNNAFGSVGFIGTTEEFGEQWLYTKPDFSKMAELNDKKITRAVLHTPRLNTGTAELTAANVASRFCSFGSNWENKTAETSFISDSQLTDYYFDLNLTSFFSDKYGRMAKGEGFILKAKKKGAGFSVISTGDNYLNPQILEINYQ